VVEKNVFAQHDEDDSAPFTYAVARVEGNGG
jgi:hypothetical protein